MIGVVASQAFSSNKLDDLSLWLEASDISTIINSGGFVSGWKDKSKNGNNVAQTTGANQPTTGIETINGVNALKFDGINDFLLRATFTGGALSQPNTIFVVWEQLGNASGLGKLIDGGIGTNRHVLQVDANEGWQVFAGLVVIIAVAVPQDIPFIRSVFFNTTSSEGYLNGTLEFTGGDVGPQSLNGLTIGARFDGTGLFEKKVGEIIIYNRLLSTPERTTVERYLSSKWGIALS